MIEQIENYVIGRMSAEEIDRFWIEMIKADENFDLLEMYLLVKQYFESGW